MNILEFLFGFPVSGCNVEQNTCYILVFCGCRWEFRPLGESTGEQYLSRDCDTFELTISGLSGNTVDLSCLIPSCLTVTMEVQDVEGTPTLILNAGTDCESQLALFNLWPTCIPVNAELNGTNLMFNVGLGCETAVDLSSIIPADTFTPWLESQGCSDIPCICAGVAGNLPQYHDTSWKQLGLGTTGNFDGSSVDLYVNQTNGEQYVAYSEQTGASNTAVKKYNPVTNDWDLLGAATDLPIGLEVSVVSSSTGHVFVGISRNPSFSNHFTLYERSGAVWTKVYESMGISSRCSIDIDDVNQLIYIIYDDATAGRGICMSYNIATSATNELVDGSAQPFDNTQIIECKIRYVTNMGTDYIWVAWTDNNNMYAHLAIFSSATWTQYGSPAAEEADKISLGVHEQSIAYIAYRTPLGGYHTTLYSCNFPGRTQVDLSSIPTVTVNPARIDNMDLRVNNSHDLYVVLNDQLTQAQAVYKLDSGTGDFVKIGGNPIDTTTSSFNIIQMREGNNNIYVLGVDTNYGPNQPAVHYRDGVCVLTDSGIAASWMIAQQGVGAPSGVATPRFIGDRYIDQSGPTLFTSYGILNTEWF